jgi:hypothetical protein
MTRPIAALALALAVAAQPLPALAASTPDDQARFLAGLAGQPNGPLESLELTPAWREHAARMDAAWKKLAARFDVMVDWADRELQPRIAPGLPLLYLFGGPDVPNPLVLFPDAPVYLLAGLEPVGRTPPPETLAPRAVTDALDALHEALRSVVPASFFRTIEMGQDLRGHAIIGVRPLAYLFLARSGALILEAEQIEIDPLGFAKVVPDDQPWGPGLPGLRIRFQFPGRPVQTLLYVRVDLGNDAMASRPGFESFVASIGPANAMLKAASFILHDNRFSTVRELLLRSAVTVLQDDSGLPWRAFKKGEWEFTTFGTYLVPKRPFARNWQPEMAKVFEATTRGPLKFTYGYRHGAAETNLLLAVRKPPPPPPPQPESKPAPKP